MFLYIHRVGATMETGPQRPHSYTTQREDRCRNLHLSPGVIMKAGGLVFLTSTKHEFSPLPLDCTFRFLTIPVDYCSCDSPQVPEPSSHILGPVFAPAYCDLFLRLESEQADSPARRARDGDHTDFLYKYEC